MQGAGRVLPHVAQETDDYLRRVPTISTDYFFLGTEDNKVQPMVVFKDHRARSFFAWCIMAKGVIEFITYLCLLIFDVLGYRRFHFKSDNEAALAAMNIASVKPLRFFYVFFSEIDSKICLMKKVAEKNHIGLFPHEAQSFFGPFVS